MVSLLALTATALSGAALALANGPSAGDNQYTDPLSGTTTTTAAQTQTQATTPVPSTPAPVPSASSASNTTTATQATATIATSTARTLPYTGLDAGLAAALGAAMVAGGFAVRRLAWGWRR